MNVPKLRFKEFNDEWNSYKFYDLVSIINGQVDPNKEEYCNLPHIGPGNIEKETGRLLEYNLAKDDKLISSKYLFNEKSVIYGKINPHFAKVCYPKFVGLCSADAYPINPIEEKLTSTFLLYLLLNPKFTKFATSVSMRTGMPKINRDELGIYKFTVPKINEQIKIGNTLELLDKKIELQSKKIEDLKLFTKKIILDTLNKENNFESKYFKEVCTIQTGKSNTQDKDDNGIYPFYTRSEKIEHSKKYIFDCEAVITIGDGNIGKIFFYENGKFDCHQRVYVLNNFKEITGKYLYYYFSTFFYKRAISMSAKNTVDSVRLEMISNMTIKFPSIEEQKRITKIFDNLELKKKLEKSKLEKLNTLKKGLMQNMFV